MRYPVGTLEGQEQIGREKQDTSSSILLRVLEDLTKKEGNKSQPFTGINGVLSRLVLCLKGMELACGVLHDQTLLENSNILKILQDR